VRHPIRGEAQTAKEESTRSEGSQSTERSWAVKPIKKGEIKGKSGKRESAASKLLIRGTESVNTESHTERKFLYG
jgi:hypothetical protein